MKNIFCKLFKKPSVVEKIEKLNDFLKEKEDLFYQDRCVIKSKAKRIGIRLACKDCRHRFVFRTKKNQIIFENVFDEVKVLNGDTMLSAEPYCPKCRGRNIELISEIKNPLNTY